jgi:transcriptional regulator with XRE-family HTH domain
MAAMSTVEKFRRDNLATLCDEAGGVARLAARLGISSSQVSQWKNGAPDSKTGKPRGISAGRCRALELAFHKPEGWMDSHHPNAGEQPAQYSVAQDLSHPHPDSALPLIEWEQLVNPIPAQVFRTALPDDALAPTYPRGTEVVWSTARTLRPGRLVLLRDQHGQAHARLCQQGRAPGQWSGVPLQQGYLTFDSTTDPVHVIAVYKGVLEPDDA